MVTRFGTVIFDCDSTLSAVEGIDRLSRDHREEVERLTEASMRGELKLEEVYARRLELVRPTRRQVDALAAEYVARIVPDAREVVAALQRNGVAVRVLSGGLLPAVLVLAAELRIAPEHVGAVAVHFDEGGAYAGFDAASPLARAGGKEAVVRSWLPGLPAPIMMVGDGATDLEVAPVVDLFVAFAGVEDRPAVTAAADVVVRSPSLAPVLPLALGREPGDDDAAATYRRGLALADAGAVTLRGGVDILDERG